MTAFLYLKRKPVNWWNTIEPKVGVNHGGTVLVRDVLDFGENGYIPLDEDTEPNFLGETMTVSEFAEEEAQDEAMQMGGM